MKKKYNLGLTSRLLNFFSGKKQALLDDFVKAQNQKAQVIYSLANRLKRLGYLEKIRRPRPRELRNFFRLTRKGRAKLEKVQPARYSEKAKKVWDGTWRLLIFDIPESEKSTREYLRLELKKRGFYMLQLSVWVTPYQVEDDLREIIEEIGARYYVRFMVVKEISYERDLLHFFGL